MSYKLAVYIFNPYKVTVLIQLRVKRLGRTNQWMNTKDGFQGPIHHQAMEGFEHVNQEQVALTNWVTVQEENYKKGHKEASAEQMTAIQAYNIQRGNTLL